MNIEVIRCLVNSDVIFDGINEMIKALKTRNLDAIVNVAYKFYPQVYDEVKKCKGDELC